MKKSKFQNFVTMLAFGPCFLQPGLKLINLLLTFLASLFHFQKGATQPPHFKTLGGNRFGRNLLFRGLDLILAARRPGGLIYLSKNYLQRVWVLVKILFKCYRTFSATHRNKLTKEQRFLARPPKWYLCKTI